MSKQNKEKKRQQIIGNIQLELFKVNVRKRERKTSPTEDSDRNLLKIGAQLGKCWENVSIERDTKLLATFGKQMKLSVSLGVNQEIISSRQQWVIQMDYLFSLVIGSSRDQIGDITTIFSAITVNGWTS